MGQQGFLQSGTTNTLPILQMNSLVVPEVALGATRHTTKQRLRPKYDWCSIEKNRVNWSLKEKVEAVVFLN